MNTGARLEGYYEYWSYFSRILWLLEIVQKDIMNTGARLEGYYKLNGFLKYIMSGMSNTQRCPYNLQEWMIYSCFFYLKIDKFKFCSLADL